MLLLLCSFVRFLSRIVNFTGGRRGSVVGAGGAELILRSVQHLQRLFWSSNAYVLYDWQLFSLAGNISNASISNYNGKQKLF